MYKCIKSFIVDICDGDGFITEHSGFMVDEGTYWNVNEEAINILGADIHLENDNNWIEVSKDVFNKCFIKVEHKDK